MHPVPSVIDEPTFWTRYFFRVYQIDKEEERRKELLEGEHYLQSFPKTRILMRRSDSWDGRGGRRL